MASILLKYGLKADYSALGTKDANTIYICTDTGEFYKGTVKVSDIVLTDAASTAAISSPVVGKFYYLTAEDRYYYCKGTSSFIVIGGLGTSVDVTGPPSSVDGNVALFDSTSGKLLKALGNGAQGKFLKMGASGPVWGDESWTPNTQANGGYVSAGGANASKVWKTDGSGNPAWRDDQDTTYSDATQSVHGLLSTTDKTKLDGIAAGAQVNVIEAIKLDGTALTITNKAVDIKGTVLYKGSIAGGATGAYGALTPAANAGHLYIVNTAGKIDGINVEVGDVLICTTDSTAAAEAGTYATVAQSWDFIQTNVVGPMSFRGAISGGSTGAYGALSPAADAGHTYIVDVAGKIDGIDVEIGDMLICKTNGTAAATSGTYAAVAASWSVVQTNVTGAVTTAATLTANQLVIGSGSGTVTILSAGTDGYVLKMVGGVPAWAAEQTIPNGFSKVAVSGQSNVDADTTTDTLTLANGSDITITTNATTDTVTIALSTVSATSNTSSASPTYGSTFTAIDSVTISNGRVTAYNTKTVTLPTLEWGTF